MGHNDGRAKSEFIKCGPASEPTSMNKKYTVKPGKSITLKYKMQKAVKYQKGGYVESTFRYHKKDYGTRHSYKHGEEYWVYQ